MKVLLLNIDSKLPNIALHKIAIWHELQGDDVLWGSPMDIYNADEVYASCIFTKNKHKVDNLIGLRRDIMVGGTGYDLTIKLPDAIDAMKPKINYGFTTRGCIRNCPFCFVPKSEGYIRAVADVDDIWDGKASGIILLDNNILALPAHFASICLQLNQRNLSVDFNQGFDIRLVNKLVCQYLERLKLRAELRFAFDDPRLTNIVKRKVGLLREYNIRRHPFFYVLVGFDTTFEEDLYRLYLLKKLDCRAYVMRHENTPKEKRYLRLAQWANQFWTFASFTYEEFCEAYEQDSKGLYKKAKSMALKI